MILASSSDWVRPIFIFCKLQFKETDYACIVKFSRMSRFSSGFRVKLLRHAWSDSSFLLRRGSRWVSHCPTRASFFSLPTFPTIQRGLWGGERNSPYELPHGSGQMPLPKRKCFANYMVCGKSKCFGRLKVSRAYISQ